jgi:tol-pal system protein YbgF
LGKALDEGIGFLRGRMFLEDTQSMEGNLRTLGGIKGWMILGLVVLLWGCATSEDVQILDEDIRQFQSQLNIIQKETERFRKDLETAQKEIAALQKDNLAVKADFVQEAKKINADLLLRLETLKTEVQTISTGNEEYKELFKKPSQEMERLRENIALRTKALEDKGQILEEKDRTFEERIKGVENRLKELDEKIDKLDGRIEKIGSKQIEIEKSLPPPPPKEALIEGKVPATGSGDLYKDAYETFQKGNLEEARAKFEAFLKQYPNTELSDNAQFWIGETYYLKKDYEKAILEYEKAIAKYPEGDKIPAALFKQALAFLELGDKTNARNLLKRVIERYPHSEQAEMAKKRLEGIK